jgi:hypothetical protein
MFFLENALDRIICLYPQGLMGTLEVLGDERTDYEGGEGLG